MNKVAENSADADTRRRLGRLNPGRQAVEAVVNKVVGGGGGGGGGSGAGGGGRLTGWVSVRPSVRPS